jgi:4-carboxymuconolactone decarboxylase
MQKFGEVTREAIFGTLWTREGLDLKTRTLITVVSDTATGRTPELRMHLRMALNHGWTENELVEAMVHLIGYLAVARQRLDRTPEDLFASAARRDAIERGEPG